MRNQWKHVNDGLNQNIHIVCCSWDETTPVNAYRTLDRNTIHHSIYPLDVYVFVFRSQYEQLSRWFFLMSNAFGCKCSPTCWKTWMHSINVEFASLLFNLIREALLTLTHRHTAHHINNCIFNLSRFESAWYCAKKCAQALQTSFVSLPFHFLCSVHTTKWWNFYSFNRVLYITRLCACNWHLKLWSVQHAHYISIVSV